MQEPIKGRLYSLDVFRGMTIVAMIIVNTPGDHEHVFAQLQHSAWNGCTFTDIIFPSFIFMMGISIVFARKSVTNRPLIRKAFRRMLTLILIGWGIQLVYHFDLHTLRYPGVLPRIGVVYFITTLIYLWYPTRYLWLLIALLTGFYYILVAFIPIDGSNAITPTHNLVAYIDHLLLPSRHLAKFAYTDPCGILSTIPSIATALIGICTGLLLKNQAIPNKLPGLLISGTLLTIAGLLFDQVFPFNKPLWSSSYVLFTGGVCILAFTCCYWLIDIKNTRGWYWPFTVLGVNAISAYVLSEILPAFLHVGILNDRVFALILPAEWASLFSAVAFFGIVWIVMYGLYKRKVFIKI